jgi:hypothetical protein
MRMQIIRARHTHSSQAAISEPSAFLCARPKFDEFMGAESVASCHLGTIKSVKHLLTRPRDALELVYVQLFHAQLAYYKQPTVTNRKSCRFNYKIKSLFDGV